MIVPINDDPWAVPERSNGPSKDALAALPFMQIEELGSVAPLDAQICVTSKLSVPPFLRPAIFGQVDADKNLATYAILDAARIPNLPEILAQGTARHECLFKGAAYDDWGHVAPWLVALDESDVLTRRLFTRGQAAWHLWDNQAGIFLRSALDLISLQRHFRKFTRVQNPAGKWYYLRFWDKSVLNAARRGTRDTEFYQKLANNVTIIWHSPEPDIPNHFLQLTSEAA